MMFESQEILRNDTSEPVTVWIEPWGWELAIPPNSSFKVVAVSPIEGQLEVVTDDATVTVYGWSGSTMKIFHGTELVEDVFIPLPDLGRMSPRSFVEEIFGGPGGPHGDTA